MYSNKKNFVYYILNNIITGLIPLVSLSIFSRELKPEDYGLYALYLIVGSTFTSFINFGLPAAHEVMFFEQKSKFLQKKLTFSSITFILLLSVIVFIPLYFAKDVIIDTVIYDTNRNNILYLAYWSCIISSLTVLFFNHLRNEGNGRDFLIYKSISSFVNLFLTLFLILSLGYNFEAFFISTIITSFSVMIFFTVKLKLEINSVSIPLIKEMIIIALPLFPKMILGFLRINYDRILINNISTQSVLGTYDIGLKVSNQGYTIMNSLYNSYLPDFYKTLNEKPVGYKEKVPNFLLKFFTVYILSLLFLALFSFELFHLTTPKSFHEAINISTIITLTISFYFIDHIPILLFLKKTKLITLMNIVVTLAQFSFGVFFGIKYGIYGFIISNLIISIFSSLFIYTLYQNNLKLNWPLKKIFILYVFLFVSCIAIIILRINEVDYLYRLIFKLTLIFSVIIIILKLKIFLKEEFDLIFNKIKSFLGQ